MANDFILLSEMLSELSAALFLDSLCILALSSDVSAVSCVDACFVRTVKVNSILIGGSVSSDIFWGVVALIDSGKFALSWQLLGVIDAS
jgi:hypothetical protein